MTALNNKGISQAAQKVPCPESTLRALDRKGVTSAIRDPWGRRLFSDTDIEKARAYLTSRPKFAPRAST